MFVYKASKAWHLATGDWRLPCPVARHAPAVYAAGL